jgi:hypothetical protein
MYIDILCRFRYVVRRILSEKERTKDLFLVHENAPAQRPALIKDFLAKKGVTTLVYPPYSSGLAQADFYLFLRLKKTLKGWHFCDFTNINKNATEELNMLPQNGFRVCLQHIYSRCQKCIFAQMDYFEGNVA